MQPGTTAYRSSTMETRYIDADGIRFAYRDSDSGTGVPLVLCNRFRGTMDDWDPALLDVLSAERRVIVFDNIGMSRSSGMTPRSLAGFAAGVALFARALDLDSIDVLGYGAGGLVAQQLALERPSLVRRLVLAAAMPGYVADVEPDARPLHVAMRPVNDADDFLYLLFNTSDASQAAGRAYLERLALRADAHAKAISAPSWFAQLEASKDVDTPETSLLPRLGAVGFPVLVASGKNDVMMPVQSSYEIFRALPDAKLVLYPDSGHGFLFQYAESFGREASAFLNGTV